MSLMSLTNLQILVQLGQRIRRKRVNMNLSQIDIAEKSGVSRRTVQAIEAGHSISLVNLIAILRSLDALDSLDSFLPPVEISPLLMAKMEGREKKRAYRKRSGDKSEESDW